MDILEARIRLNLQKFWPVVARSKNLLARGLLGSGQKKWAQPSPKPYFNGPSYLSTKAASYWVV